MKTKITVAIIGVIAIFAVMLRKSLIGGFDRPPSGDGRGPRPSADTLAMSRPPLKLIKRARPAQSIEPAAPSLSTFSR